MISLDSLILYISTPQVIIQVSGREKRTKLEQILKESGTDRTLVFVEKKKDADFLAQFLSQRNFPATSMNGDRSQQVNFIYT